MLLLLSLWGGAGPAQAQTDDVRAYVFWQQGCPFCERAREALALIEAGNPGTTIEEIEVGTGSEADRLFTDLIEHFRVERAGVPLFVVGDRFVTGFRGDGATAMRYAELISGCRATQCPDLVASLRGDGAVALPPRPGGDATPSADTRRIALPWGGELALRDLSLPVLTVVLAAVDGFNPCAMWVLALLIGLLLNVQDSRRMWTLGAVFLGVTGAMYFAVMAAWLNVVLWIGALSWLRYAIGAVAVGGGVFYLREYWTNPEGVCKATPGGRKRSIGQAFRRVVDEPSLLLASLGVAALAVSVNLIELVCSAGIPAVYTQVLAMHDLPGLAHYGYLALYLGVFLADDTAIFVIAMLTLRSVAASGRFSRYSHLIGGVVLLGLGLLMVLRPDLLS